MTSLVSKPNPSCDVKFEVSPFVCNFFYQSCLGVAPMERMGFVAICEGAPTSPSWRTSISCDGELGAAPES